MRDPAGPKPRQKPYVHPTFINEDTATRYVTDLRWKDCEFCPLCASTARIYHFADGRNHKCAECRGRFSIRVGTIFEGSKLPLRKWLHAIWLIIDNHNRLTGAKLAREIGVTHKSASFVLHRLRTALPDIGRSGLMDEVKRVLDVRGERE